MNENPDTELAESVQEISHQLGEVMAKPQKPLTRTQKARALVNFGLADTMAEARAMLTDMGE